MSYDCDASEPVRRYHALEREFERRQALLREPLDVPPASALSPWSLFTGLMTAMRGVTRRERGEDRDIAPFVAPWKEPVEERHAPVDEDERVLVGATK